MKLDFPLKQPRIAGLVLYLVVLILQLDYTAGSNQLDLFKDPEFTAYAVRTGDIAYPNQMQLSSVTWHTPQLGYPQGLTFSNKHILIKSPQPKSNDVCYSTSCPKNAGKKEILIKFNSKKKRLTIEAQGYPNIYILRTRQGECATLVFNKGKKHNGNPTLTISCEMGDMFELFPSKKGIEAMIKAVVNKERDTLDFATYVSLLKDKHPNVYYLIWTIDKPLAHNSVPLPPHQDLHMLRWHLNASRWSYQFNNQWFTPDPIFKQGTVSSTDLRFAFSDLGQDLCPFELRMQNQRYGVIFQEHSITFCESFKLPANLDGRKIRNTDNCNILTIKNGKLINRLVGDPILSTLVIRGKEHLSSHPDASPLSLMHGDRILFSVTGPNGIIVKNLTIFNTYAKALKNLTVLFMVELEIVKGNNIEKSFAKNDQNMHYALQDIDFGDIDTTDQRNVKPSQSRRESLTLEVNPIPNKFLEITPIMAENEGGFSLSLPEIKSEPIRGNERLANSPKETIMLEEYKSEKRSTNSLLLEDAIDLLKNKFEKLALVSSNRNAPNKVENMFEEVEARFNQSKMRKKRYSVKKQELN